MTLFTSPTAGSRLQKEASMERALRTLTPTASPKRLLKRKPNFPHQSNIPVFNSGNRSAKKLSKVAGNGINDNVRSGQEESVRVAIRIRPLGPHKNDPQSAERAWKASPGRNSITQLIGASQDRTNSTQNARKSNDTEFTFDKVFGEDSNTNHIYDNLVGDIVASVTREGINGTVFTYGQTSSGKTFTMQGCLNSNDEKSGAIGIIQLAAKDIFQSIKEETINNAISGGSKSVSSVRLSYLEIYNEEIRDLLAEKTSDNRKLHTSLTIREDRRGLIKVENLKEVTVNSLEHLMDVFRQGETNKAVGSTKMNDRSSRSHAILKITFEKKTALSPDGDTEKENSSNCFVVTKSSTLNLVDLAGSESVRLTGASGMQKKEGGMINQSLLTLSKVLMSLGQKTPGHINYRDSKLTRILKPSLSGNARMAVICCISPSGKYVEETKSTLQFATRAKLVKTNAIINEVIEDDAKLVAKLQMEVNSAKQAHQKMEGQLRQAEGTMAEAVENAVTTKIQLSNLKRFVFHDRTNDRSLFSKSDSECFTFEHYISRSERNRSLQIPLIDVSSLSKDDSYLPVSDSSTPSSGILRTALDFKAKQVKRLQEEVKGLKELRANSENDEAMSSRNSLSGLSLFPGGAKYAFQESEFYKKQNQDLDSKLESANTLIASLQRQVDELSVQKSDALDWIEELFAKVEDKEEKLRQECEAKNEAESKFKTISSEYTKTKELLEFTIGDLERSIAQKETLQLENEKLKRDILALESVQKPEDNCTDDDESVDRELAKAMDKIKTTTKELNEFTVENERRIYNGQEPDQRTEEISQLQSENEDLRSNITELKEVVEEHQNLANEYAQERRVLLGKLEHTEEELAQSQAALASKAEELENTIFTFECEKSQSSNEKAKALANMADTYEAQKKATLEQFECEKARISGEAEKSLAAMADDHEIQKKELLERIECERTTDSVEKAKYFEALAEKFEREKKLLQEDFEREKTQLMEENAKSLESMADVYEGEKKALLEQFECERKLVMEVKTNLKDLATKIEAEKKQLLKEKETSLKEMSNKHETEKKALLEQFECEKARVSDENSKSLESIANEYESEKKALLEQIEKYEDELSEAEASVKYLSNDMPSHIATLNEKLKCVKLERDRLNEEILVLRGNEDFRTEVIELRRQSEIQTNEMNELHRKLQNEKKRAEKAEADIDEVKLEVVRLKADNKSNCDGNSEELNALRQKFQEQSSELNELRLQMEKSGKVEEENRRERANYLEQVDAANGKIDDLQRICEERLKSLDQLHLQLKKSEAQAETIRKEAASFEKDRRDLLKQLADQKAKMNSEHDSMRIKLNQQSTELSSLRLQLKNSEQRSARAESISTTSQEEKAKMVKDVAAANDKLQTVVLQLKDTQKELYNVQRKNMNLEKKEKELRSALSRIQDLADDLTSEHSDLKTKNGSLMNRTRELEGLLSSALNERDVAIDERDRFRASSLKLEESNEALSTERDLVLYEKEKLRLKMDKATADYEAGYEAFNSKLDVLCMENKDLGKKLLLLDAGKHSIEDNADRILERENTLMGQHERLKVDFKKQTLTIAELKGSIDLLTRNLEHFKAENNQMTKRLDHLRAENDRMSRENTIMKELMKPNKDNINASEARRRGLLGFRAAKLR